MTKQRKPPISCRPEKDKEWIYDKVAKETKKRKITSSALLQELLINHYTSQTIYEPKKKK